VCEIEPSRYRTVRRRLKIRGSADRRVHDESRLRSGVRSRNLIRPAIRIEASVPVLIYKGSSGKEFSVCAVEHVEHSIAVRLQKELAVLATPHSIDEHDVFGRIPVVAVVGRELVMPFPLAGIGIECDNGVCEEIVPITANRAVNLRSRI